MDDFDISLEGYTPESEDNRRPYRPPMGTYRPPVAPEPEETCFQPEPPRRPEQRQTTAPRQSTAQRQAPKAENRPKPEPKTSDKDVRERVAAQNTKERKERIKELKRQERGEPLGRRIVNFFTDYRTRYFLGAALIIISVYTFSSIISHFSNGAEDQSVISNLPLNEISEHPGIVKNSTGGFGAWFSKWLLCDTLGLASLILIVYEWILALALFGVRKCKFWATTFRCLLLAISASIVLGFITYSMPTTIYWGGIHGHYINKYLFDNASWIGAACVSILLIVAVCCVYLNELRIVWKKWRDAYRRHKLQEELRRERQRELERLEAEEDNEGERQKTENQNQQLNISENNDEQTTHHQETTVMFEDDITFGSYNTEVQDQENEDEPQDDNILQIDPDTEDKPQDEIILDDDKFSIVAPTIEVADSTDMANETDNGEYDHRAELSHYVFPPVELLEDRPSGAVIDMEEQQANKAMIEKTLLDYKIPISRIEATVGPTVTLYEIVPAEGVRISQIKRLEDDIALSLKALGIRIIAPIPGKGTVGIEVPNNDPQTVSMRSVLSSKKYQESKMALPMAMGATISNEIFIADMAKMPHLLVAGATGMGKSVGLNAIIASLLYKKHPSELKLVLIDPKMVEFSLYSKIEHHFLAKLPNEEDAIITDMKKVIQTLNSLCVEMDDRYELLRNANVRSLEEYNRKFTERRLNPADGHKYLPYIVVIVDEFADLIMTQGKEVEQPISRIAQKARAVGIHMILATQRPSTNVITGLIKANFPGRIAFRVIQMVDSRTILDCPGANQLIGKGDMLFSHNGSMERVQCAFISTEEVEALTEFIDRQVGYEHAYYLPEYVPEEAEGGAIAGASTGERDALFNEAARFVVTRQMGSTSSLQRQFGVGYNRAGKLMDQMEAAGIVGPVNGAKPRQILMDIVTLESILGD